MNDFYFIEVVGLFIMIIAGQEHQNQCKPITFMIGVSLLMYVTCPCRGVKTLSAQETMWKNLEIFAR